MLSVNIVTHKMTKIIETERLILRTWRENDVYFYHQINQDKHVLEFLRFSLTLEQAQEFVGTANRHQDKHGYALWAVELKNTGALMGFIGLNYTDWKSHFTPAVEVGWRLGSQFWGKGYATEGARASLAYGFEHCGLKEIVSFTVPANTRSIRVMEKLGLRRDFDGDFFHPKVESGHKLSHHILYRIKAENYYTNNLSSGADC